MESIYEILKKMELIMFNFEDVYTSIFHIWSLERSLTKDSIRITRNQENFYVIISIMTGLSLMEPP